MVWGRGPWNMYAEGPRKLVEETGRGGGTQGNGGGGGTRKLIGENDPGKLVGEIWYGERDPRKLVW